MDFEKLLKLASTKQKNAEKELPQTKRYNASLPPPKKAGRPKVDPEAIKAIINKKEKIKQQEASDKVKKKQAPLTAKHGTSVKDKPKVKIEKNTAIKSKTDESKKTTTKVNYKSKEHESKHKHFMNMIDKNKEKKQETKEPEKPCRQEKTKKKPTNQPMNFKELMELAKRKQNGEVIVETNTTTKDKQQPKTVTSKTNGDVRKSKSERKCNKKFDSVSKDLAKVKLKNSQPKGMESQEKKKIINDAKTNNHKVTDIKGKDAVNGKSKKSSESLASREKVAVNGRSNSGLKKTSDSFASREKAAVNGRSDSGSKKSSDNFTSREKANVNGRSNGLKTSSHGYTNNERAIAMIGGKMKKPTSSMPPPPPHQSHVNGAPLKRKAPPPKMKVKRGRLCSDDEDDEEDDFIDDAGKDVDVSKYIREIFGYDKRNYGYESEHALGNMEASFTQIMKEESRTARLGRLEDIEDMKQEQMQLERKKARKSKR